jgi:hypothetical protein
VHLGHYLRLLQRAEQDLAAAFRAVGEGHADEVDVYYLTARLAEQCDDHAARLQPFAERYSEDATKEPERLHSVLFTGTREGGLGLLRDLHDLYLMATECDVVWTLVAQAARGARDTELLAVIAQSEGETARQLQWLKTRMKQAAPQALVVAS